jgi:ribonuclease P protein component
VERQFRLTRTTDFMRVRRSGKSYAHPLVVLITTHSNSTEPVVRIGVSASQAVGKAVQRNRAKRRIRACVTQILPAIQPGNDLIFLARRPIEQANHKELCDAIKNLLKRAGLLKEV